MSSLNALSIKSIKVTRLFDLYDYILEGHFENSSSDKILIIYGDNGSGKTTILRLLFHILATELKAGHKSAVAKIPFKRFEINFSNSTSLWVQRHTGKLLGSFDMGIKEYRKKSVEFHFEADEELSVTLENKPETYKKDYISFLKRLSDLNIALYLLTDDRTVHLSGMADEEHLFYRNWIPDDQILISEARRKTSRHSVPLDPEVIAWQLLKTSISRTVAWIREQVMRSSSIGESNVNTLYSEILNRLLQTSPEDSLDREVDRKLIEKRVKEIEKRSTEISKYGLRPGFIGKKIVKQISQADKSQINIINNVVGAYLDSLEEKLDAMSDIYRLVDTFVKIVNGFLVDKHMEFDFSSGLRLISLNEKHLNPEMLSSGERHLLLLFCNSIVALEQPSIIIIDEPEISLNIKWQRKLISSLLELVSEKPIQYIFATHSLEILYKHRNCVVKLSHIEE